MMEVHLEFPHRQAYGATIEIDGQRLEEATTELRILQAQGGKPVTLELTLAPRRVTFEGDPVVWLIVGDRRFRVVEEIPGGL